MDSKFDWAEFFEASNEVFIKKNRELLDDNVSERALCGCLSRVLHENLKSTPFAGYHVDVEYNRNQGKVKTIINEKAVIVTIVCDLIIHSRGKNKTKDNLVAIEMKKSNRPEDKKQSDRERLMALTKPASDVDYIAEGPELPEHVCGYDLGIYYEIDTIKKRAFIEYYKNGIKIHEYQIQYQ